MTDITVANTDWAIVSAVRGALAAAQIDSQDVFADVTLTTSREQARQCQFSGPSPRVIVRYVTTCERVSPEDVRGCYVALELIVSSRVSGGVDESARIEAILRLANAAKNAVESGTPTAAAPWGDNNYYHDAVRWGDGELDIDNTPPWVACHLPVTVGFVLESGTSH